MELISTFCAKYKFIKNLIVITAGQLQTDFDGISEISDRMQGEGINLTVMQVATYFTHLLINQGYRF